MKKRTIIGLLMLSVVAWGKETAADTITVHGKVQVGALASASNQSEKIDLLYQTQDARLGTNSGNRYASQIDVQTRDAQLRYGALLKVTMYEQHQLGFLLEGKQNWQRSLGTRTETVCDKSGTGISRVSGSYNHPLNQLSDLLAGVNYTYSLSRGDSLKIGYRYHLNYTSSTLEQQVNERVGWALYSSNLLDQQIREQTHHASIDYICRLAKGHALDMGVAYDRRQMDGHTLQEWDQLSHLDAAYQHLTQYGALYARYRLMVGPVRASVGLEYRATKMQERWMHDYIPSAMVRYQIDSVHALMGGYRMLIIRPEYSQLDTNTIQDAYTRSFGQDALVGTHVHNTNLSYQMTLPKIKLGAEIRYITAKDGMNALWMERNNVRIYTWGNEGVRQAVSLMPSVDARVSATTRLQWSATVLWDERIANAISMSNANWGIRTNVRLEQQLPYAMTMVVRGDYAYHNTLDLYSYAGHGGKVGADWQMALLKQHNLQLQVGYTCLFTPDIHITQGGWTGIIAYPTRCIHQAQLQLTYIF